MAATLFLLSVAHLLQSRSRVLRVWVWRHLPECRIEA
jgi:hypothetical protein